jgi:hypothetical protein
MARPREARPLVYAAPAAFALQIILETKRAAG